MNGQRVILNSNGIEISAYYFHPTFKKGKYPAIIIAHGLPARPVPVEEKGYDILAKELCQLGSIGFITLIFNFRGCKGSGGLYSPLGWIQDLQTVIKFLLDIPELDKNRILLLGFSAGATISVYFTAQTPEIKALICCATPSDLSLNSPLLKRLVVGIKFAHNSKILRAEEPKKIYDEFILINPLDWVEKIYPRPILITHGKDDQLINVENAYKLYNKAKEPKKLIIIDGAGHELRQDQRVMTIIKEYILNLWRIK